MLDISVRGIANAEEILRLPAIKCATLTEPFIAYHPYHIIVGEGDMEAIKAAVAKLRIPSAKVKEF